MITRQELYDLVWSKPTTIVVEELVVSSRNMARICLTVDLPGKSGGTVCRLVHFNHLAFECDGRFVSQC